jgi:peptidyl-prolyl cis-trans isomerase B (cyclophilin B)
MKYKFLPFLLFCLLFSACTLFPKNKEDNVNLNTTPTTKLATQALISPSGQAGQSATKNQDTVVALKINGNQILIKLYAKEAPNTVDNFLKKVNSGFYNGLKFHRVEPGFVAQGGDPKGNGTGGGKIKSEINSLPFRRGSVGLARGSIKEESNDSQFFICLATDTCSHLTNEYVNFGEVVSGMEFVDNIAIGDKITEITSYTK